MFTHSCSYTHMSTHFTTTATYVPSCISLFSCILPFGRRLHSFFFASSAARELASTFYFQSKIEILQAYLHVRPHTRAQKRHVHGDSLMHAPCGHAFFCLPVSSKKKGDWREKWTEECWKKGRGGRKRRTYLHWWMKWTHVVFFVTVCLRDSHHCHIERLEQREGWVGRVWRLPSSLVFCVFMESWKNDNNMQTYWWAFSQTCGFYVNPLTVLIPSIQYYFWRKHSQCRSYSWFYTRCVL